MGERKYTEGGLPKITPELIQTFFRDYDQARKEKSQGNRNVEMVTTVVGDNDAMKDLLEGLYERLPTRATYVSFGVCLMYSLLLRQTESSRLEDL